MYYKIKLEKRKCKKTRKNTFTVLYIFIGKKKKNPTYKWSRTVEIHVVQVSTIFPCYGPICFHTEVNRNIKLIIEFSNLSLNRSIRKNRKKS